MNKRWTLPRLIWLCLVAWSALSALAILSSDSDATATARKRIGVSLLTQRHQFYRDLEAGLKEEARAANFDLLINYAEFDHVKQAGQVEAFIAKKVDALIIAPCDSIEIGAVIEKANRAGIPVVTVDIANASGRGRVLSHVASNNYVGGRKAGELLVQALRGKGKVMIINHPGVTSVTDRVAGFRDYVKDFPGIQVVADIPGWGQRDRATAIMEEIIIMYPQIDGVFAINDDSALGVVSAIEASRYPRKIVIVGYDGTDEAREAIRSGKVFGDIVQYPRKIGTLAIRTIRDHFQGKRVEPLILVEVGVIRN